MLVLLYIGLFSIAINIESKLSSRYKVDHKLQQFLIAEKKLECQQYLTNKTKEGFCPPTWDGALCWPNFYPVNEMANMTCPDYIDHFLVDKYAYKYCTANGTWFTKMVGNKSKPWTDFSKCTLVVGYNRVVLLMCNACFGVSMVSVVVATIILRSFKNLHCDRNTIHINLFMTCLLRSFSSLISYVRKSNDTNILCKIQMFCHNYTWNANFTWVFIEALYLHNVLTVHTFLENSRIIYAYIAIGWGMPFLFVLLWMTLRLIFDNTYCWDLGDHPIRPDKIVLIIYPSLLLIQNLVFFVKLIIILYSKMTSQHLLQNHNNKFMRMGKSIIVLMVVFGLYHLAFIPLDIVQSYWQFKSSENIRFYLEYTLNSVQGMLLSLMFCFCNGEVHKELKRKLYSRKQYSKSTTRNSDFDKSIGDNMITSHSRYNNRRQRMSNLNHTDHSLPVSHRQAKFQRYSACLNEQNDAITDLSADNLPNSVIENKLPAKT